MPVKIWNLENGQLTNSVKTSRDDSYRGEQYRGEAEALDEEIDRMLDQAAALSTGVSIAKIEQPIVKRWAVGRALAESQILESAHLDPDDDKWLWLAIARKCRLGVRADGSTKEVWRGLIPDRESDPRRIERDVFAMGLWLQEQELKPTITTFGTNLKNAQQIHRRGALSSKKMRESLERWSADLSPRRRLELMKAENFEHLAKALARRFPARGPGSAKRPVHYSEDELFEEVRKVLDPVSADIVPIT